MSLRQLLSPKSIAIVGVSSKIAAFQVGGRAVFDHLRLHNYAGALDIVTRDGAEIDGVQSVTDLSQLKTCPDCLAISVPANDVLSVVEQALDLGVRAFMVISGGFSEAGPEGVERQAKLAALIADAGASLLGPNTTGYVNFASRTAMSSTSRLSLDMPSAGGIGVVVQSGALGSALLEAAAQTDFGLSYLISTGNEAATEIADFIEYLVDDDATKAIALYVEAFRNPTKIIAAARKAHAAGKPIAVYKAGRSAAGEKAAVGHTGALLGTRGAYDAAVRQLGWVDVRSIEDLLPVADYLAKAPAAHTMGVLTVSGGLGGCVVDALEETGLVAFPNPNDDTVERMRAHVPSFLSANNPVDVAGAPFRQPGGFEACLEAFAEDPAFDAIAIANTPIVAPWAQDVAEVVPKIAAKTKKPISVVWPAEVFNGPAIARLRAQKTPVFTRISTFVEAFAGAAALGESRANPSTLLRDGRSGQTAVAAASNAPPSALNEWASKVVLQQSGMTFLKEEFSEGSDVDSVLAIASGIGYPIVLKGMAAGVVHKSDVGLVAIGVPNADALAARVAEMLESADRHGLDLEGFIVSEAAHAETEVILGLGLDAEFGPILTFGAGGIYTEVMQDVAIRLLPLDDAEIRAMIASCRIHHILSGARGRRAMDVDALVKIITDVTALAPKLGTDFTSVEFNPIGIGYEGEGAWIFDATVFR